MDEERKQEMIGLQKLLIEEFEGLCKETSYGALDETVFALPKNKLSNIGIRGYFVRKMYDYIIAESIMKGLAVRSNLPLKWFEISLPLLAEMIISLQYYHNQILDRKGGIVTHAAISNNLIAGNLFRSTINYYIEKNFKIDELSREKVRNTVDTILTHVDIGQYLDKNWGNYECLIHGLPQNASLGDRINSVILEDVIEDIWEEIKSHGISDSKEQFTKMYLRRIYLCNGSLFILFNRLLCDLLEYKGDLLEIERFCAYLAIPLQIMNDNIDFLPPKTVAKGENDVYSDLKNHTMSLPLIFYFEQFPNETPDTLLSNLNEGIDGDIFTIIFNISKPITEKFALKSNSFLNIQNEFFKLLVNLNSTIFGNKYYGKMGEKKSSTVV